MSTIYQQLMNRQRALKARNVRNETSTVIQEGKSVSTITSRYEFTTSNTGITQESLNLIERTNHTLTLAVVKIVRSFTPKSIVVTLELLADDEVIMMTDEDPVLRNYTDHEMLSRLNITVMD